MTPAELSARRILAGGALFVALGALGVASALPASADQLVWSNAQAWVSDGDLVTGYSTAVSFGGDTEDEAVADPVFGPLAEYARVKGESRTLVNSKGALSEAVVERASVRIGVDDLIGLGMIDAASEAAEGAEDPPTEEPEEPEEPEESDGPDEANEPNRTEGEQEGPPEDDAGERESQWAEEPTPSPPFQDPSESPSASPGDEDVVILGEGDSETVSTDGNAVEFTLTDVRTSAAAAYDGSTEASFEYGELTAFGEPVVGFDGDHLAEDTLEVLDDQGDTTVEVPVSIRFLVNEHDFDDENEDWEGEGIRSSLTVWVQVGDPELGYGFSVDFADSWALGSTHAAATAPGKGERGEGQRETAAPSTRLATTGSSVVALVTAAVVAVGGGAAATFLARKRTTAMDDQIED
ncbi:hypothetical protein HNR07_004494 [Nocardiopsis metallicus]|uniref:Uncharacterized protein n=1 Tax=Nocardiopsis metallicus TaxID=179819 RepID=A0A840WP24_9ACTN|nr:hypothetical protein [Nocardiopsis metallicus]MBB5493357.1 hypothetical protein [Nocardiopsis metallicus]